jgi:hypothetical protein
VTFVRTTRAFLVVLGVAIAACGDSSTEPTVGASGSLSFSYTGAGAATATQYSAEGAIPANVAVNNGSSAWAAGSVSTANTETDVVASLPKSSNNWDLAVLTIARTSVGASTIDITCSTNVCTTVTIWFGANQNQTNYTYICTLTSGTVNITAISSANATGTFSGSGTCSAASTGATSNFTVTGGTFNVGLTTLLQ